MIGRKREVDELNRVYNRKKAELVAIYGRRRVGKTYLVNHTFMDRIWYGWCVEDAAETVLFIATITRNETNSLSD